MQALVDADAKKAAVSVLWDPEAAVWVSWPKKSAKVATDITVTPYAPDGSSLPVITPDTPVARQPSLDAPSAQVSPLQWALLVRAGEATTARGLAMQLGQSVFGTTIEVYRLVQLGLLSVPGQAAWPGSDPGPPRPAQFISFIRAASGERGSDG